MCGIAGFMSRGGQPPHPAVSDRLAGALAHRGPDGRGGHAAGAVALVHTRLAIVDLVTGDQPFRDAEGRTLVANGEIYNDPALRTSLAGTPFASASDCEPPLYLYGREGVSFADLLRGMYAIALHDPGDGTRPERLVLARDPFGIKPLYCAETESGFAFASEPKALLAAGLVAPQLDEDKARELLALQFTTGDGLPLAGIRRLLPGETVVVEAGRIVARRRRPALPAGGPRFVAEDRALAELDAALADSVAAHQRADVPYGMFLSGGVDSSALLTMMARLNSRPVLAFTAWFPGTSAADERELARAVASATGAEHIEVPFTEDDFWGLLPAVAEAMDDPAADYACLPTFKLAAEARTAVKVILSGEGGDELMGGYGRYRAACRPWPLARPMRRKGALDGLGVLRQEPAPGWRDGIAAAERAETTPSRSRLQRAQAVDCADWLPNDLLAKLDRCLMAHGVEGRVPFLDPVVAGVAFRLPDRAKLRRGLGKWLLRRWLEKHLPAARPFAPKQGFTVPVGEWIAARGARIGPLVAAEPGVAALCRPEAVTALFAAAGRGRREGFAAWMLLFFALWHQRHVLGLPAAGDALETLACTRTFPPRAGRSA